MNKIKRCVIDSKERDQFIQKLPVSTWKGLCRMHHIMKKIIRCFYCHFYMCHTTERKSISCDFFS